MAASAFCYLAAHIPVKMNKFFYYSLIAFLLLAGFSAQAQDTTFDGRKNINGTELYLRIIGEGEPILLIHGGPGVNHEYFLPHLLPLAQKHKLVFYDQRSSGRSAISEMVPDLKLEKMVQDIEAIRDSFKLGKINIMAHSWGARLAAQYVLSYPASVKSLMLVSPVTLNHDFDKMQMDAVKEKTEPQDEIIQDNIVQSEAFKNGEAAAYQQLLKLSFKTSFFDTANMSKLNIVLQDDFLDASKMLMMGLKADGEAYNKDLYPMLAGVKSPVLIIHGDADNIPIEADEKLKASLPKAELVRFSRSGHFPFIEENEKFIKTVRAFLEPEKKEEKKEK